MYSFTKLVYLTQFQIEGSGLLQGVIKLITSFSARLTEKMIVVEFTKKILVSSYLGCVVFLKKRLENIKQAKKWLILSLFLQQQKYQGFGKYVSVAGAVL